MRYQPDDTADQSASRRRSQRSGPDEGDQDASVFGPGYGTGRDRGPDAGAAGQGRSGRAGSAAGKGPVRGYPPLPGQPPPLYPPGQFAAWNQRPENQAAAAASGPAGPGRGPNPASTAPAGPGRTADAGYYGRDSGPHAEPGYSVLAVSDPAADVTSTQTWQAVGDGRATGTWSAPARPGGAAGAGPEGGAENPDPAAPGGRRMAPWSPQAAAQRAAGTDQLSRDSRPSGRHSSPHGPDQDGQGRSNGANELDGPDGRTRVLDHGTGPRVTEATPADDPGAAAPGPGRRARRGDPAPAATTAGGPPPSAPRPTTPRRAAGPGRKGASRRGKHPASAKFAIAGALVIVLAAGVALYLGARAAAQRPRSAAQPKVTATVAAPSPTPTIGAYGYIGSRKGDPMPLTVGQLYPKTFSTGGVEYTLTRARLGKNCVNAVNGANLQGTVTSGVCSQVARATYLASKTGMMGTIGVLNLATAKQAAKAARAAGAQNFIVQLTGRKAPTSKIGQGSGLEEALAKGHYLILIWAELTSLKTPHKGTQRTGLAQFMTQLFAHTANASLTDRMISGSPSPAP